MSVSWNLRRNLSDERNQNTLPWIELSVAVAPKDYIAAVVVMSWLPAETIDWANSKS